MKQATRCNSKLFIELLSVKYLADILANRPTFFTVHILEAARLDQAFQIWLTSPLVCIQP